MDPDVLVVGGGPAGASTAFQLARAGVRVTLLDRARFPRSKPCAECLSPQATRILLEMDVLPELERRGTWLRGMLLRAPNGVQARGEYGRVRGFRAPRDAGLAIPREVLDDVLLRRARDAGAKVFEGARVTGVLRARDGAVRGVRVTDPAGASRELGAQLVVGADGLRSVVAHRLGLARLARWPRRIAIVARYSGVSDVSEYVELHVERGGVAGVADVGGGLTTVAAVFPESAARQMAGDATGYLSRWLAATPHLAARFRAAMPAGPARAVGPFASRARRAWHPGALLVGDAADFFDPFTGEGIYAALRGGELAAGAALAVLGSASRAGGIAALRDYERARRREFGGKWRVEWLIGAAVACPPLLNRAARALAARTELADLLAGVTGDFVPPSEVLRISFLAMLFVAPIPTRVAV